MEHVKPIDTLQSIKKCLNTKSLLTIMLLKTVIPF